MAIRRVHFGHIRRPHMHASSQHLRHWVHDGRFWAILAIIVLSFLMILAMMYSRPDAGAPIRPIYPYYWPYPTM